MTSNKRTSLEQFLLLFNRLKEETGSDPAKVTVFYGQKSALTEAVDAMLTFVGFGDFERRVIHHGKKYVPQAPDGFDKAWTDFKDEWYGPLLEAWFPEELSNIPSVSVDDPSDPDAKGTDTSGAEAALPTVTEPPDPDFDLEFDPLHHDGGKAFEMAFWITESYADEVGGQFEERMQRASKIGLDAYDYLQNTVGFNPSTVFRRWRQLPVVFVPRHVSDHHGLTEKGSLYELLDDAMRAYVFGASAAAVAMCRAILEMLLKEHYELDYHYKDRDGRTREKGLGDLIILAAKKYEFIEKKRLKRLTDNANGLMHNYKSEKESVSVDEEAVVDAFKLIKFMIENAPKAL
jgi:hypothetical protein